jgi:hypothetical protein
MKLTHLYMARTVLALRRVIDAAGLDKRTLAVRIWRHNEGLLYHDLSTTEIEKLRAVLDEPLRQLGYERRATK